MNMKKTTAGVLASIVAISAMATTIASAKDIAYAAIDTTYSLKAGQYKAAADAEIDADIDLYTVASTATINGVTIAAANGVQYTYTVASAAAAVPAAFTSANAISVSLLAAATATDLQTALNLLVPGNFVVTGTLAGMAAAPGTTVTAATANMAVASADVLTLTYTTAVKNIKVTIEDINNAVAKKEYVYTVAAGASNFLQPVLATGTTYDVDKGAAAWTLTGITAPSGSYKVTVDFDVPAKFPDAYDDQNYAANKNPNIALGLTAGATGTANGLFKAIETRYKSPITTAVIVEPVVSFEVKNSTAAAEIDEDVMYSLYKDYSFNKQTNEAGEDIIDAVSQDLEARTKAQVIFKFDTANINYTDDVEVTAWFDTDDFGILKAKVNMASDGTATINWIDLIKSKSSTNTLGDISNKLEDIQVKWESDDSFNKKITLKSVGVKGAAENYVELSAGEAAADKAAVITTAAPAVTTAAAVVTTAAPVAATTAAAANPKTGNAPIALAVIPVAIAAAAIIAKKRG